MARLKPRYRTVNGKKTVKGYCAVFYDPDRRPREKSVTLRTSDKAAARRTLVKLEDRYSRGEWDPWKDRSPEEGLSVDKTIERFVAARQGRLSDDTIRADKSVLGAFSDTLPVGLPISSVEPYHLDRYIHGLRKQGRAADTLVTYYARLSKFFAWAKSEGLVRENPAGDVERPKPAHKEKVPLTREQFDRLVAAVEADAVLHGDRLKDGEVRWLADVFRVAVATGLRRGELCAMRWSWVDLARQEITVRRADGFVPKGKNERTIPVRGAALDVLRRLDAERSDEDDSAFVFQSTRGRKGDGEGLNKGYVTNRFAHYRDLARITDRASFHSLRHSFCTWLIQARVPLPTVQRLAGHADIKTTMSYVHVARQDLHDAVEATFTF